MVEPTHLERFNPRRWRIHLQPLAQISGHTARNAKGPVTAADRLQPGLVTNISAGGKVVRLEAGQ